MLYISRFVGSGVFGVADTDDDSEEVVTTQTIVNAVGFGLSICGVSVNEFGNVDDIEPYQLPEELQLWQTKLKVMFGVDIRCYKGAISFVDWEDGITPQRLRLRLSKYCNRICSYAFMACYADTPVIFELDDNIQFDSLSLASFFGSSGVLDITALTDEVAVHMVYSEVFNQIEADSLSCFIDGVDRLECFMADYCIKTGDTEVVFSERATAYVTDKYDIDFEEFLLSDFRIESSSSVAQYIKWLNANRDFWESPHVDCKCLRPHCQKMLKSLAICTDLDVESVEHFTHYYENFEMSEKFQNLFVEFAYRVANEFLLFGEAMGIIS